MYTAFIVRLTDVRKHPNADRLQVATALGNQVVVGLEHTNGELGIFFPADGQLSEGYANANDLVSRIDENGAKAGGFLDSKRRIRAQRFRGVKSEGLWMPLSSLDYIEDLGTQLLAEGTQLTEWTRYPNYIVFPICNRYETPATRLAAQQAKSNARPGSIYFPKHVETDQFTYGLPFIVPGSKLYISEKLHGTSHREGNTWMPRKLNGIQQIANKVAKFLFDIEVFSTTKLEHVVGTRNTVLGDDKPDYYSNLSFRLNVSNATYLNPGIIMYGEIVGFVSEQTLIMPEHNTDKINDKAIQQQYGKTMRYTYGAKPNEQFLYVYRVVQVDRDTAVRYEYTQSELETFAKENGIQLVPLLAYIEYDGNVEELMNRVFMLVDGPSMLDDRHIREGVVIRVETPDDQIYFLKHKSFAFKVMEGIAKNDDTVVDIEESS